MAERLDSGSLPGVSITWVRDDVTLRITGIIIVNTSGRTLIVEAGGRTRNFPDGTNQRVNFPTAQRIAYTETQLVRPDGKTVTNWLPEHRMYLA